MTLKLLGATPQQDNCTHFTKKRRCKTTSNAVIQLNLFPPPQENFPLEKRDRVLQITEESSFSPDFPCYLLTPFGWRVPCPLTEEEATEVIAKSNGWDFTPASTDSLKPRCWGNLEALIESLTDENNNEKGE